jgi:hypothetical protein
MDKNRVEPGHARPNQSDFYYADQANIRRYEWSMWLCQW